MTSPVVKNIYVCFPPSPPFLKKRKKQNQPTKQTKPPHKTVKVCIWKRAEERVKKGFVIYVIVINKIIGPSRITQKKDFLTHEHGDGYKALFLILKFQNYFTNNGRFGRFLSPLKKKHHESILNTMLS